MIAIDVNGVITEPGAGPIAGASIRILQTTVVTDATGAFVLPTFNVELPIGGRYYLSMDVTKEGFDGRRLVLSTVDSTTRTYMLGMQRSLFLAGDGTLSTTLYPDDIADYVGEAYESDYCWSCKTVHFQTPRDTDIDVVLRWSESPTLRMWALDGSVVDASDADAKQRSIRLPRGRTGTLIVGTPSKSSRLAAPVPFRLSAAPRSQ